MSSVFLEVNGKRYEGFTDINVSRSIENLSGQFSFSTTVKENSELVIQNDLKVQDEVRVYIDDNLVLTGYIEQLNISYSGSDHSISVSGRDKTGDLIDSSAKPIKYIQTNFIKLVKAILSDNGYSNIKVINNIGTLPILNVGSSSNSSNLEDGDSAKVDTSASVASFLDNYAKKIQVLLISDKDGNINVTNEGSELSKGSLISTVDQSNILSANINVSSIDRFRYIEIHSQGDNSSFTETAAIQTAVVTDNDIRNPRRKLISVNTASQASTLEKIGKWNVNIRRAKGLRYNCTVQGYYSSDDTDSIWLPNTLVEIRDDRCQINGQFLIQGVTYRRSLQGSFTDLSIVQRGAFSVEPPIIENNSSFGENLLEKLAP